VFLYILTFLLTLSVICSEVKEAKENNNQEGEIPRKKGVSNFLFVIGWRQNSNLVMNNKIIKNKQSSMLCSMSRNKAP